MVKGNETGFIKRNTKINLRNQLYKFEIDAIYLCNGAITGIKTMHGIHEIGI